jgi:recombination protein RecT
MAGGKKKEEQSGIDWEEAERASIQGEQDDPDTDPEEATGIPPSGVPAHLQDGGEDRGEEPPAGAASVPPVPPTAPRGEVSGGLATRNPHALKVQKFGEILNQALPQFRNVIPKGIDPSRLIGVALSALERNPGLLECTGISVLRGILIAGQLGLDASGIGGMGYLVPYFNNKTGKNEAQFIVGYRGMVELARRGGVAWIHAQLVYANEPFSYTVDPIPRVSHKPYALGEEENRGELWGAYAVAIFKDGSIPPQPLVISKKALDRIRSLSKSAKKEDSPWNRFPEEMMKKTAVRALCKMLPQGPALAAAIDVEERQELGEVVTLDGEIVETEEAPAPSTKKLASKLKGKPS